MESREALDLAIKLYDNQRELTKRMDRIEAQQQATRELAEHGAGGVDALGEIFLALLAGEVYATTTVEDGDA